MTTMTNCNHLNYKVDFSINRVGENGQAFVDFKIACGQCGEPFLFTLSLPPAQAVRLAIAPENVVKAAQRLVVPATIVAKNGMQ